MSSSAAVVYPVMACTECGEEANASCYCYKAYLPKGVRAAKAIAANPGKSDRAIAADIGVAKNTVRAARQELVNADQLKDGPRIGLDGKTRKLPQRADHINVKDIVDKIRQRVVADHLGDIPSEEEAEESHQQALYDQACLFLERMTGETRQRFFATLGENTTGIVEQALALVGKMNDDERRRFDARYTLRFCDVTVN